MLADVNTLDGALFREVQRFRQAWLWAVLIAVAVLAALSGAVSLAHPASALVIAPFALLWFARLEVEVRADGIHYRFLPFHLRWHFIPIADIAEHAARTYSPLGEYGGWGIRGFGRKRAYSVSGDRGVQLVVRDGRRVLFGSQKADEFDEALAIVDVHGT
jgi:hypothetical protein